MLSQFGLAGIVDVMHKSVQQNAQYVMACYSQDVAFFFFSLVIHRCRFSSVTVTVWCSMRCPRPVRLTHHLFGV